MIKTRKSTRMVSVRFIVDHLSPDGQEFKAGKVYEMSADSAGHYITRNLAERYKPAPKATKINASGDASSATKKAEKKKKPLKTVAATKSTAASTESD
jgi:hypothetical protein